MHSLFHLLSRLPLPLLHALGVMAGRLVYLASPTYRRNLRANLGLALGAETADRLVWRVASEAGKAVLEAPLMWCADAARVVALAREIDGWEHVERARTEGRGLVFLTPHLGCFEITAQFIATRVPISVLYRVPRQSWLDRLMREGRSRPGMSSWPADLSGVRALMKALRRKEAVGLLPDQAPKAGEGVWVPFFGRPAYTMTLAGRLAEGSAELIFVWGERLPFGRGYRLHFSVPAEPLPDDLATRAARINRELEALIRSCPTQYLWGYNRYKRPAGADEAPPWNPAGQGE
jgi:KDO2-lipid IV(A) lauroyltransferase